MSAKPPLIYVVDDDRSIREALCEYLSGWSFLPCPAASGGELDALLERGNPDAIILDIMMSGEDGLAICKRLNGRFPVLMLSALGDTSDRIVGLELGADDYLPKPFDPRELVARLRAIIRRRADPSQPGLVKALLEFDGWLLDEVGRLLIDRTGRPVSVTAGEFELLCAFLARPQQVLSRDRLLQLTQGPLADASDRAIDLGVSRLRRKLAAHGGQDFIQTVWGEGYRFSAPVHKRAER